MSDIARIFGGFIILLIILFFSLNNKPLIPAYDLFLLGIDKWGHLFLYLSLIVLWGFNKDKMSLFKISFFIFLMSFCLEIYQSQIAERKFEILDLFFNGLGLLVGSMLILKKRRILNFMNHIIAGNTHMH